MQNITEELERKNCVICLHCGAIYEHATREDYWSEKCQNCDEGYFNYITGRMHMSFWRSPAAHALNEGKVGEYKRGEYLQGKKERKVKRGE